MTIENINITGTVHTKDFQKKGRAFKRWKQGNDTWLNVRYNDDCIGVVTSEQFKQDIF